MGLFLVWGVPVPTAIALGSASEIDLPAELVSVAIAIIGVRYAYGCNGGAVGRDFAVRLIAVAWVVGVRFTLAVLAVSLLAIYPGLSLAAQFATRFNVAMDGGANIAHSVLLYGALVIQALYWWFVGSQLRGIPAAA